MPILIGSTKTTVLILSLKKKKKKKSNTRPYKHINIFSWHLNNKNKNNQYLLSTDYVANTFKVYHMCHLTLAIIQLSKVWKV